MLERLAEAHERIRRAMEEFNTIIDRPYSEVRDDIARRRVAFSKFFRDHLSSDNEIVQNMSVHEDADVRLIAKIYSQRFGKMYLDYSSHIRFWLPERICEDQNGYKAAVRALQRRLLDLMDWEEAEMIPALQRVRHQL